MAARVGFKPVTPRMQGTELTTEPPCLTTWSSISNSTEEVFFSVLILDTHTHIHNESTHTFIHILNVRTHTYVFQGYCICPCVCFASVFLCPMIIGLYNWIVCVDSGRSAWSARWSSDWSGGSVWTTALWSVPETNQLWRPATEPCCHFSNWSTEADFKSTCCRCKYELVVFSSSIE